jgi:Yip1 domain
LQNNKSFLLTYIAKLYNMNIIERVKSILLTPKNEWNVIDGESDTPQSLLTKYVVPLALIGAIAGFIGYGLIGVSFLGVKVSGIKWGLSMAIRLLITSVLSYYICSYVIDALAPTFKSEKNINKSAQLVAYASTAGAVGAAFYILPALSFLAILAAIYGIYLFYTGLPVLKKTPQDQVITYMIVSAVVIIVVSIVLGFVIEAITSAIFGNPYAGITNGLL